MAGNPVDKSVADAPRGNLVDRLAPTFLRPWLRMARLDRPIGFWLLFWPCAMSLALAAVARPMVAFPAWGVLALFLAGAVVMRGAGCVFNDIIDRDIDAKVERTRSRPLVSGQIGLTGAILFMVALALAGLLILVQFNTYTIWLGLGSLVLIAIYPFMKRITFWPQLFLGLAFSWGALMGWASDFGALHRPAYLLYAGCIAWVIGYDTIYALQDREDDALVGVRSTARLFGRHVRLAVFGFYVLAAGLWIWAGLAASAGTLFLLVSWPAPALLLWQVLTLKPDDPANCLTRFKANHWVGLALVLSFWVEYRF
ncbi:MAG: 4-hydroxybenzoate octaprenyltransferase [Alphaproteobacteria bacterium]|nr:4-hydroxybenzoate octaprenyltransferase [Alphaproteobacteria bacterium]